MEEDSSHDWIESAPWRFRLFDRNSSSYQILWYLSLFLVSWLFVLSNRSKFRLSASTFSQSNSKNDIDDGNISHGNNDSSLDNITTSQNHNQKHRNIITIIKKTLSADDVTHSVNENAISHKSRGNSLMSGKLSDDKNEHGNESKSDNDSKRDIQQLKKNHDYSGNISHNNIKEEEEDMDQEEKEYNLFVSTYHQTYGLSKDEGNIFADFEHLVLPPACRRLPKHKMKSIESKPSISILTWSTTILTNIIAAIIIIISHITRFLIKVVPSHMIINEFLSTKHKNGQNTNYNNNTDGTKMNSKIYKNSNDDNDVDDNITNNDNENVDDDASSVTDNSTQLLPQSNTTLMNTTVSQTVVNLPRHKSINCKSASTLLPDEYSPLTKYHLVSFNDDDIDDLDDQPIPIQQDLLIPDEPTSSQYSYDTSSALHHHPQASSSPPVPTLSLPALPHRSSISKSAIQSTPSKNSFQNHPSSMKKKDALESFRLKFRDASNPSPSLNVLHNTSGLYTPPTSSNTTPLAINPTSSNNKSSTVYTSRNTADNTNNVTNSPEKIVQTSKSQTYMHDTKKPILSHYDKSKPIPKSSHQPVYQSRLNHNNSNNSNSNDLNFFDAINSQSFLRKLSRDTPLLPDKNGYIGLGDEFLRNKAKDTPLLVFVNSRAGSQQGLLLQTQLKRLLNPIQIWDLGLDGEPESVLQSFSVFSRLRILVCGGDGTVSWIISALDKMMKHDNSKVNIDDNHDNNIANTPLSSSKPQKLRRWPPIAILPLGTGNDLARIYGWGGGYNNESLLFILQEVQNSYVSLLDRWELQIINETKTSIPSTNDKADTNNTSTKSISTTSSCGLNDINSSNHNSTINTNSNAPKNSSKSSKETINNNIANFAAKSKSISQNIKKNKKIVKNFTNYMSIGSDASSALQVHMLRENSPILFFSRAVNKVWYAIAGAEDALKASCAGLQHIVSINADGVDVPIPANSQGIIVLNIDSYTGGVPLWSKGKPVFRKKKKRVLRERRYSEGEVSLSGSSSGLPLMDLGFSGINVPSSRVRLRTSSFDGAESLDESDVLPPSDFFNYNGHQNNITGATSILDDNNTKSLEDQFDYVTSCNAPSSCQDGKLDVVSYRNNFHLGQIRVGLSNADLLCQCSELTIDLKKKAAVQVDGEPWKQDKCQLKIKKMKEPAIMLHKAADDLGGVETEMAKLLDWAEDRQIIDRNVHATLMREFSRRIESKTREKRDRPPNTLIYSVKKAITSSNTLSSMY